MSAFKLRLCVEQLGVHVIPYNDEMPVDGYGTGLARSEWKIPDHLTREALEGVVNERKYILVQIRSWGSRSDSHYEACFEEPLSWKKAREPFSTIFSNDGYGFNRSMYYQMDHLLGPAKYGVLKT